MQGVFSRDSARRAEFSAEFGFPQASSLDALIEDPRIDAILVLTPPSARVEIVQACANAGKHVLMEKPIERTTAVAHAIVDVCEKAGVKLAIVFQHRFRGAARTLKEILARRSLGEICAVQVVVPWWRPQAYYDEPGRGTYSRDGGGVLITQAIHTLDLMLSLAGPVSEVQAIAGTTRLHRMESEDFVAGGLKFANGALGSLVATTAAFPGAAEHIVLDCERGSARLAGDTLTVQHHDGAIDQYGEEMGTGGGADPMAFPHDWHRAVIADFAEAVVLNRPPAISGREGLHVHLFIDALIQSAGENRVVPVMQVT